MLLPSKHILAPPSRDSAFLPLNGGTTDHSAECHNSSSNNNNNNNSLAQGLPRFQVFVPPFRFALVEQGIYRGGYPRPRNLPYLRQLKFRTILSLTPDPLPDSIAVSLTRDQGLLVDSNPVQSLHIHVAKPKEDQVPLDAALALKLLTTLVLDPARHPMYIHCLDGQLVTGSLIMALRKVQGWSAHAAIAEFQRCIRGESVPSEIAEFIHKLGGELDFCMPGARSPQVLSAVVTSGLPSCPDPSQALLADAAPPTPPAITTSDSPPFLAPLPKWFWGGSVPFRKHPHPSLKLKLPPLVPCPHPHILALVGPLEAPVAVQDPSVQSTAPLSSIISASPNPSSVVTAPSTLPPNVSSLSSTTPVVLARSSSANAHDNSPSAPALVNNQQPTAHQSTPPAAPTPSQTLKDIKARLLTDILLGTPTLPSTSAGGGAGDSTMSNPTGAGGISGLGILMAAAAASNSGGSSSSNGGGGTQGASGGGVSVTAAAIAAGLGPVVHQESDDGLLDDLDDADDDEDVDGDGDEVNLSRMVQALNLEGLSG